MSKVVTYYADTPTTQQLVEEFGTKFQKISKQDKLLMIAAIALENAFEEGFAVVMEAIDPDRACNPVVREAIEVLVEEERTAQISILLALTAQVEARIYALEGK